MEDITNPDLSNGQIVQRAGISFGLGTIVAAGAVVAVAVGAPVLAVVAAAVVVGLLVGAFIKPQLFKWAGAGG